MKIRIKNIRAEAIIGTLEEERKKEQELFIDVEFEYSAKAATQNDDIFHALDYSKITDHVINIAKESKCMLIETLAERVLELLKSYSAILTATVKVRKPGALENAEHVTAETNF